ncbi:hypothetical protein [Ralstonia insidiosa]|jgi:hypothetical protein|nr:hypothetical protein [Ralstonia insidiosa]MBA9940418.1 hypothetical protein [Ralstonia insidiosa]MBC9968851.1 hypothetical protein [Ralstonia insidiosa]MBX3904987.1 hypothetical protein [Ralstonia insidiosa]
MLKSKLVLAAVVVMASSAYAGGQSRTPVEIPVTVQTVHLTQTLPNGCPIDGVRSGGKAADNDATGCPEHGPGQPKIDWDQVRHAVEKGELPLKR